MRVYLLKQRWHWKLATSQNKITPLGPHKHGPFFTIGQKSPKTTFLGLPWHRRFGSKLGSLMSWSPRRHGFWTWVEGHSPDLTTVGSKSHRGTCACGLTQMYGMTHGHWTVEDDRSQWFQSAGAASNLWILELEYWTRHAQIGSFSLPRTTETPIPWV